MTDDELPEKWRFSFPDPKFCSSCKTKKRRSEFYKNKAQWDGIGCYCKKCEAKYPRGDKGVVREKD